MIGGLLCPATGAIVTEESPARLRGLFAGMLQAGYPLGWFLGSVLAATLLPAFGWRALFVTGLMYLLLRPLPSGLDIDEVQRRLQVQDRALDAGQHGERAATMPRSWRDASHRGRPWRLRCPRVELQFLLCRGDRLVTRLALDRACTRSLAECTS